MKREPAAIDKIVELMGGPRKRILHFALGSATEQAAATLVAYAEKPGPNVISLKKDLEVVDLLQDALDMLNDAEGDEHA